MFGRKRLEKPEGHQEQLDALWDIVTNHIWTKLTYLDWQVKFLVLLNIALITVILIR